VIRAPPPFWGIPVNADLEERLGHRFAQPELLVQALTHRSWPRAQGGSAGAAPDNERFEFLGDAVLGLRVSERLLESFPASNEGQLSRLRGWMVSARHLASIAERLDLGRHLRLSRAEEAIGGRHKQRLLANGLEAVIAAIHLDAGYAAAAAFVDRHIVGASLEPIAIERLHEFAYKSALQEWSHAAGRPLPRYRVVTATGPEHDKLFTVEVSLDDIYTGTAEGLSKKDAEQRAAAAALQYLGLL